MTDLTHPGAVLQRLAEIEADLGARQEVLERSAMAWFKGKRDREQQHATVFLTTEGTVAERKAHADKATSHIAANDEAEYEAVKAVVRVLETRASIGQSILKAQTFDLRRAA